MSNSRKRDPLPGLDSLVVAGLIQDAVGVWSPLVRDRGESDLDRMWEAFFNVSSGLATIVQGFIDVIDNSPLWRENEAYLDPLLGHLTPVFGYLAELNDVSEETLLRVGGDLSQDLNALGNFLIERLENGRVATGEVKEALDASFLIHSQFQRYRRVLQVRDAENRAKTLLKDSSEPSAASTGSGSGDDRGTPKNSTPANPRMIGRLTADGSTKDRDQSTRRGSLWKSFALWATKTAGSELTRHFDEFVARNSLAAGLYRASSIVLTVLVLGAALWTYIYAEPDDSLALIWRSSLLVGSIGLAAYLARQGAMHHELATWAKTIAVQLSTFESYLASVEDEETVAELRQRFAHRVFMSEPSPARHPRSKVNLQSVIDGAGEALKNSKP